MTGAAGVRGMAATSNPVLALADDPPPPARFIIPGDARGAIVAADEGLSFWGGVDPATGRVIDARHPLAGLALAGAILMLPTSRGSCSGSGVLLDLALEGRAPAALIFREDEEVLTLGALVAAEMFGVAIPVMRLEAAAFVALAGQRSARIEGGGGGRLHRPRPEERRRGRRVSKDVVSGETSFETPPRITVRGSQAPQDEVGIRNDPSLGAAGVIIGADGVAIAVAPPASGPLDLSEGDRAMLDGAQGPAAREAMRILTAFAREQGARALIDVTRVHIDGCIYACPANLTFAERMADMGATVRAPTTTNAISVDRRRWEAQGVPAAFGGPASRLADAYVRMGAEPTFTCAPYLLDGAPKFGEIVGWGESNAVVFANSVIGARTAKLPDFLDLCVAVTGRAPAAGVILDANRKARRIIEVERPDGADDSFWPLIGYLAGLASPDRIPLLRGLHGASPPRDDLKALCAAFGTTSAAPMLHIEGVTPEADGAAAPGADRAAIGRADMARAWASLNGGPEAIDLVAIGSPHASLSEMRALADALDGGPRSAATAVMVTAGRDVLASARREGVLARLEAAAVSVLPDLCWCSISEPVFPVAARVVLTNSGKYAHYGPGLSGRTVRFGALADCVAAATTGRAAPRMPWWLG